MSISGTKRGFDELMRSECLGQRALWRAVLGAFLAVGGVAILFLPSSWAEEALKLASRQEILKELREAPRSNADREKKLKALFVQAGAREEEVKLEAVPKAGHNVVVVKKGEIDRTIIIGAHLDKVPPGDGVIDDWSGATMVANVYQALRGVKTRHTLVFIGFCGEEAGLLGSAHHAEKMSREEVKKCAAMVNLEVLGVGGPFIWSNGSTDSLEEVLREVAREEKLKITDHVLVEVAADSQPFEGRGIPTITIDGLPEDRFDLIHSPKDTFKNIDPEVYHATYRLVAAFIRKLDGRLKGE